MADNLVNHIESAVIRFFAVCKSRSW
ncbi:hypothetical protein CCACVL1_17195 [Corchorus capsularis]|uniref:Uncharacterized protein n=1 Tax=Corchorus capsularis TaxID=210143 RepID=A0A1R3HTZ2_COCAP|nr:hypothetical protein CCACVL1_17195 [Corchorus capsularis]